MKKEIIFIIGIFVLLGTMTFIQAQLQGLPSNLDQGELIKMYLQTNPEAKAALSKFVMLVIIFAILMIIDIILRGFAMWKAAKKKSKIAFWLLLVVNTMGIFPLLYLIFAKSPEKEEKKR